MAAELCAGRAQLGAGREYGRGETDVGQRSGVARLIVERHRIVPRWMGWVGKPPMDGGLGVVSIEFENFRFLRILNLKLIFNGVEDVEILEY